MRRQLLGLLFICMPFLSCAQNMVSGKIVTLNEQLPVAGVNVFVINTLNGTLSNNEGNFILQDIKQNKVNLLISHVSFETQIVNVDLNKDSSPIKIQLKKRLVELDEVSIEATKDKQWKKYLKKFNRAFFGKTDNANKCEIVNPWVLDFDNRSGDSFTASALAPLEINNLALGYNLLFYLEHFSVKGEQIEYAGKPFFKNIESKDLIKQTTWDRNRDLAYKGSKRHFLFALANEILKQEGFLMYKAKYNSNDREFEQGKKVSEQSSYIDGKLVIADYLNIVYIKEKESSKYLEENSNNVEFAFKGPKADLIPQGTMNTKDNQEVGFQNSYLYILKNKLALGTDGLLLEPEKTKEFGYWSWEGIAELLPFEYLPKSVLATMAEKKKGTPKKNGFILSNLRIDASKIMSGGPAKDGIPALYYPKFINHNEANYLKSSDKVIGIFMDGTAKAYPINILNYHEIVNDSIGSKSYAVTFCPLCGSGITFSSLVKGKNLTFGVSGLLFNSDVLMYDKQTESLWSQLEILSVTGKYSGSELEILPTEQTTWQEWKDKYPETKVQSIETGHSRDYRKNPYEGYDQTENLMFGVDNQNKKYANKELTLGIEVNGIYKAFPFSELDKSKPEFLQLIGGKWLKVIYNKKQKSAMVKTENNELYPSVTLFWFAWNAFHPETEIYSK
jgi:hypothetical protein